MQIFIYELKISNGYSRAIFSEFEYSRETRQNKTCQNETRQNGRFRKYARLARVAEICRAVLGGLARIADIRRDVLRGLAWLVDIRQAVLRGLARLAKGEFGKCYANLARLG